MTERIGPLSFNDLCLLAQYGEIKPDMLVSDSGDWITAKDVSELAAWCDAHAAEVAKVKAAKQAVNCVVPFRSGLPAL